MTNERLIRLAYNGALTIWGKISDFLEANPGDELMKAKEREAWAELQEVHNMLLEVEHNKETEE